MGAAGQLASASLCIPSGSGPIVQPPRVGYGKARLKNKAVPPASENRRVEVVNLAPQPQAQR